AAWGPTVVRPVAEGMTSCYFERSRPRKMFAPRRRRRPTQPVKAGAAVTGWAGGALALAAPTAPLDGAAGDVVVWVVSGSVGIGCSPEKSCAPTALRSS